MIKDHHLKIKLLGHPKEAELLHHRPGIAHAAAVAYGDTLRTQRLQSLDQRPERIGMGRTGGRIGAVEVGFEEKFFALDPAETQQIQGFFDSDSPIIGFDKGYWGGSLGGEF
ncbi:MAG: hypothetical protein U0401_03360 [Anaerolineae bacterium]